MATTYLQAVNEILAETNEVQMTPGNFSAAVGIQSFVKSIINRAYLEICAYKQTWPFLAASPGNINDPYAGNVFVETVPGQRWYLLNEGSTKFTEDFGHVDWKSFLLTDEGMPDQEPTPIVQDLSFLKHTDWVRWYRANELQAADKGNYGVPKRVIDSADGRYFGLSPIPDKVYKVYYPAWVQPTRLVSHDDELAIPDKHTPVLYDRARYFVHQFKENEIQANLAQTSYRRGIQFMVQDLIGEQVKSFGDDRRRF